MLPSPRPPVAAWLQRVRRRGAAGAPDRDPADRDRLESALQVAAALPRRPDVERSALAAQLLGGDPHALDTDTPLERLVRGILRARAGSGGEELNAPEARALWSAFGVRCDSASCAVLTLGLRPRGRSPLARALRALAGVHVVVTLGQLESCGVPRLTTAEVFVCENPAVALAAQRELGARCPALVCTGGWPNSAAQALLAGLRARGAALRYHGGFDWDGLAIARQMRERLGALPWRHGAADYRAAADGLAGRLQPVDPSRAPVASEDELSAALRPRGVALPEELVLDQLLADLTAAVSARRSL